MTTLTEQLRRALDEAPSTSFKHFGTDVDVDRNIWLTSSELTMCPRKLAYQKTNTPPDNDYIDEIHRLVAMGLTKIVLRHSFAGIESNETIRHCIFVLSVCANQQSASAVEYDQSRNPFGVSEILGFICRGDTVLDAGCGTGQHAQRLARVAGRVVGIDTDAERIELARKSGGHLRSAGGRSAD